MKNLLIAFAAFLILGCGNTKNEDGTTTYKPTFSAENPTCADAPIIDANSVQFGSANGAGAGRVVSNQGYKGITQIRAKADFSNLTSDFVINTFYMVNNPDNPSQQPIRDKYCDAGGNTGGGSNCQEIDFFEGNKNVVFQHTMHIGEGSASAPQNWQYSYSSDSEKCYPNLKPGIGIVSWNGMDVSKEIDITIDLDSTGMNMTFSQGDISVQVYTMGSGFGGSKTIDAAKWEESRQQGYWLLLSQWQWNPQQQPPWAPGSDNNFWNWDCPWGPLCGTNDNYFKVYDIEVDAEGTL